MELEQTGAYRRTQIREYVCELVRDAVDFLPNCEVFAARGESKSAEDFVAVYFDDVDRERRHNGSDAEAQLVVRVNTKAAPQRADERLDDISSHIEKAFCDDASLGAHVNDSYCYRVAYSDSKSGVYSAVELFYLLKYDD